MHITISGRLGSGKSTVGRYLSGKYGFVIYSTGAIQRELAAKKNLSTLEMNELMKKDPSYDHWIDETVARISEERKDEKILFDSRMAWHFAHHSFRVFLTIDPQIAGNRCVLDRKDGVESYASAEEARDQLLLRGKVENARFIDMYGVDNLDYRHFDLVVDSSVGNQYEVGELVYAEYLRYCEAPEKYKKKIYLAAQSIYPASEAKKGERIRKTPVPVFPLDGYHYASEGVRTVLSAIRNKVAFLPCRLVDMPDDAPEMIRKIGADGLSRIQKENGFSYPSVPAVYR